MLTGRGRDPYREGLLHRLRSLYADLPEDHPCATRSNGPVPDPDDCSSYYLCSNTIPYRMKCPGGTVWSVSDNSCSFDYDSGYPCLYKSGSSSGANSRDFVAHYTDNLVEPVEDYSEGYREQVAKEIPVQKSVAMETVHSPPTNGIAQHMLEKRNR